MSTTTRIGTGFILAAALAALVRPAPAPAPAPAAGSVTPINTLPFEASAPGTYCVTANLQGVAGEHGITVSANNVVIDLGGHQLVGLPDALDGIHASGTINVRVLNGSVRDWGGTGVLAGRRSVVKNVDARECGLHGIAAGDTSVVVECTASANDGFGLLVAENGVLRDSAVLSFGAAVRVGIGGLAERVEVNEAEVAFIGDSGSRFVNCAASNYSVTGFEVGNDASLQGCRAAPFQSGPGQRAGVVAGERVTLESCKLGAEVAWGLRSLGWARVVGTTVSATEIGLDVGPNSTVSSCSVSAGEVGVRGGSGTVVERSIVEGGTTAIDLSGADHAAAIDNQAFGAAHTGIAVGGRAVVTGNRVFECAKGIAVTGDRGRIDGNTLTDNGAGLVILGSQNLATGNRAVGSAGADFTIPFPNTYGPTLNTSWALQGSIPHANFRTPQ